MDREATEHQCLGALIENAKALKRSGCFGHQQSEHGHCKSGGPGNSHQPHVCATFSALPKVGPEQVERYRLIALNPKADFRCLLPNLVEER